MHLIKNNVCLYFFIALFCHIALLSAFYNWSEKSAAGTQQATSITTYFVNSALSRSVVPLRKPSHLLDRLVQSHGWRQGDPELYYDKGMLYSFDQLLDWIPLTTTVTQQHSYPDHQTAFVRGRRNERVSIYATRPTENGRGAGGEGIHTPEHHGYSKLLALLHTKIQEKQTYPLEAVTSQQSGTAIVNFTLLPNGNIVNRTLHQSSGYDDLDQAALDAVQAISPFKTIAVNARQNFDVAVSFVAES